jgi:hypothetical protein
MVVLEEVEIGSVVGVGDGSGVIVGPEWTYVDDEANVLDEVGVLVLGGVVLRIVAVVRV